MKLRVEQKDLLSVINSSANIVDRKATMPILANFLITAKGNELTICATDLEVTAVVNTKAEIFEEGSTTINAKIFSDIIRELSDGPVNIELQEGERIEITSGGSEIKVIGASAEEFPSLPGIGLNVSSRISAAKFLDMINKTLYAVSDDETSYNLTGVCFSSCEVQGSKGLRMVATDGHRISIVSRPVDKLKIPEDVIVPKKGLAEIKRNLSDLADAEIGIAVKDGFLIIDTLNAKLSVRLIDADFPDYEQVVPKDGDSRARVNCEEFAKALRRASLMATDKMRGVKVNFLKDKLEIRSSSPELGESFEHLEIEYQGDPVEVGYNSIYLSDAASSLSGYENMTIEVNGSLGPGKFLTEDDPDYFSVVMPMRIGETT